MSTHTGATTNYAIQQPSYEYTDRTTQFDDELLKRGIVTQEQVLLAKGMSIDTAKQLIQQKQQKELMEEFADMDAVGVLTKQKNERINKSECDDDDNEYSDFDDDDDEFLQEYKQRRLIEIHESAGKEQTKQRTFGDAIVIDRTEWQHHVNEDSIDVWVVVGLLSTYDSDRTAMMKKAIYELASTFAETKFVLISSHQAIPNWPEENLPSLFVYRHGVLQHEMTRLPVHITTEQLEDTLHNLNIF
jgi:hypothetical protein